MKKLSILYFCLLVLVLLSCKKDNSANQHDIYTGQPENISIQEIAAHYNSNNANIIEDDWIIKARIIANDESKNLKNRLYIQDASGAVGLIVDTQDMAKTYKIGQQLYIHLKGLKLINTNGTIEIGASENADHTIPEANLSKHLFLKDAPDITSINIKPLYLSNIHKNLTSQLVSLKGILLTNGGKHQFAGNNEETIEPVFGTQDTVCLVTSPTASFSHELIPAGNGEIIGILTKNKLRWEIRIRKTYDLKNFSGIITEVLEPHSTIKK